MVINGSADIRTVQEYDPEGIVSVGRGRRRIFLMRWWFISKDACSFRQLRYKALHLHIEQQMIIQVGALTAR